MESFLNTIERIFRFFREIALFFTPLKYYRNDPDGFIPLQFASVIKKVSTKLRTDSPTHWTLLCTYQSETRETQVFLTRTFDPTMPSLVFHHPSGETNHAFAYNFICGKPISKRFNVFLIKAQKHGSTREFLRECVDSFLHHQLTFAGSALAVDAIVTYHKTSSNKPIIASGASMGGIVATLHAYFFGTADYYLPLAAYPNVGEIFTGDSYRYGMAHWEKKHADKGYRESFALSGPFPPSVKKRILPILGIKDRIVTFDKASAFWKSHHIRFLSYPYGHFTPAIMRHKVQKLLLSLIA